MVPAWEKASDNARENGSPFGITITSTPSNLDIPQGAFCKKLIDGAAKFTPKCFDMTDEELRAYVEETSNNNFMYVEYSYQELGKDEAWLRKTIRDLANDMGKVKREILLEWPHSTEGAVFSEEQLDGIHQFVKLNPVTSFLVDNKWLFNFYESIDLNKNYILSCDVSGGLSNDNSVICVIDPETFKPIGYFKNNKIDTDTFKNLIKTVMTLYMRNSVLLIERNSYGLNLVDSLMKDTKIEPRMYRENKEQVGEKTQKDGLTIKRKTKNVIYGVNTTKQSRQMMYDILMTIVDEEANLVIAPELYSDISHLEKKKTGKIEAMEGEHDDCLMAYLIFRYAVYYGTCFRDRFGISPIPSSHNVKVISSEKTLKQVERLLMNTSENTAALQNNPMYAQLVKQQQMINAQYGEEKTEADRNKLRTINNICKWNE